MLYYVTLTVSYFSTSKNSEKENLESQRFASKYVAAERQLPRFELALQ